MNPWLLVVVLGFVVLALLGLVLLLFIELFERDARIARLERALGMMLGTARNLLAAHEPSRN